MSFRHGNVVDVNKSNSWEFSEYLTTLLKETKRQNSMVVYSEIYMFIYYDSAKYRFARPI